ncbi:glycerol acyltransferase [Desulfopila sp. IMCC35006]|uniref:lysophospholipid acyltransferase family protein n=1 Tax=Desulfopila sp. IMCC35006 TaxID=2569542 RepID=UPI0010AC99F2|nr:lysophospholipid acyltransferase family protein [Desulfopila sp. IMCC35006]TKB27701.1 glycerol acyltransferase [Desulfopila sp. IMCC35006]
MIQSLSASLLSLLGWHLAPQVPADTKIIIIGAPHTSNWDFPMTLLALSALGLRYSWIGKHTMFKEPFGSFFKKIGGIPVDRKARSGFIDEMVRTFAERDRLVLAIAPEGTRARKDHWKAGFYQIAVQAHVNICLGYIDYPTKTIGLGPVLVPTGDILGDFNVIKAFYQDKKGKYPHKASTICLRDKEIALLQQQHQKDQSAPDKIDVE